MIYRALGLYTEEQKTVISFTEFHENAGLWNYELKANSIISAREPDASKFINRFIDEKSLQYQVALVSVFSATGEYLSGSKIAAETCLPVITDLAAMDIALGGNGEFFTSAALKLGIKENQLNETDKAICVAFMGVLRWREEYNFLSSVTGALRNSIGGAVWLGQEA